MAISGGDGSIILTTKVDETGLNKGIKGLKGGTKPMSTMFRGLGATIAAAFSIRAIKAFADESKNLYKIQMQNEVKLATVMRQRMKATDDEIKSMLELASAQQQIGIIGDEVQLAGLQQIATFATQKETIETLLPAMNNLIAQQYGYEASTESARNAANLIGKVLQGQTGALTRVGITFSKTEEQMLKTGNEMERAAVLAQVITNNVGEMNQALAKTDVGRQKQLANTLGDIKEQFGAALTQIAIVFLPVLQRLANILAKVAAIARTAAQNIANAFGKSNDNANAQNQTIQSSVKNQEALTEAVEDTAKAQKKSLAGFDEINTLTENSASSQEDIADLTDITASGGLFSGGIQSVSGDIDAELATIMGYVGFALAAIGIIMICFGHIGWGIGFLIAGAGIFSVSQAALSKGAELKKVKNIMNGIIAGISLLALVLGIILVCTTKNPKALALGIGLIVVGAAGLATEIALNWNAIKENIQTFFTENGWLIAGVSLALLVIGVLLCFAQIWGLGIGLIAAGAAGLVAVVAINWNSIKTAIVNTFNAIVDWVKTWGLLVLGIILVITGVGIPIGIPLIKTAAGNLTEAQDPTWLAILDKIKEVWGKIKDFWNRNIAPIFTLEWWENLAKTCGNGLISGFEAAVNGVIWLFESLINFVVSGLNSFIGGLSTVTGAVGDLIGVNLRIPKIPKANLDRVSIPRLAQGAVIPPNREFLAVLGDQKHGTNIEAPLDTIKQAVAEVLAQVNVGSSGYNGRIEVPVIVDGREIARAVREAEGNMGSQTVFGGFANVY